MIKLTFDEALQRFIESLQGMLNKYYSENFEYVSAPTVKSTRGRKYIRIITHGGVYCFVDRETGNLLKAASWKAPEPKKYRRGNIYQDDNLEGCGPHGVVYFQPGRSVK